MGRKNLNLELAVQAAKAGYTPQISWAKSVAKKKQMRQKEDSEADSIEILEKLRVEKIRSKLFYYQKQANKIAKKEKTLLVRRLARKVKELIGDDVKTAEKKQKAMNQLEEAKKVDHTKLGVDFLCRVLQNDEQVWSRVKDHVSFKDLEVNAGCPFAATASYKKEQASMFADVKGFLAKLFNESTSTSPSDTTKEDTRVQGASDPYFVASLNQADESDDQANENAYNEYESEGEDVVEPNRQVKKKKNRLGQRARRELWEQKYGDKAKHVRKAKDERKKARPKKFTDESKIERGDQPNKTNRTAKSGDTASLHPSWAAKLEQKRRLQETSSTAPTRIVFD